MADTLEHFSSAETGASEARSSLYNQLVTAGTMPALIDRARWEAVTNAHSYRNFQVGAAALFLIEDSQFQVVSGANFKLQNFPKRCAERAVLGKADEAFFEIENVTMLGLAVAATTDRAKIAEVSMRSSRTLHPCEQCRDMFKSHPFVTDETVVLTTGIADDAFEVQTIGSLYAAYAIEPALVATPALDVEFTDLYRRVINCPEGPVANLSTG